MPEKEETKDKNQKLEFLNEDSEKVFADVIQMNVTQETVNLELALRNKDNITAEVSHTVYLTLPHFLRFAEACSDLANKLKKEIEKSQ